MKMREHHGPQRWYARPVQWCIEHLDGVLVTSLENDWDEIATMEFVALGPGVVGKLPFSEPIRSLYLQLTILPTCSLWIPSPSEEGIPFYAFARYAMSLTSPEQNESQWCYTLFGYVFGETRTMCLVTNDGMAVGIEPSSSPFSL